MDECSISVSSGYARAIKMYARVFGKTMGEVVELAIDEFVLSHPEVLNTLIDEQKKRQQ